MDLQSWRCWSRDEVAQFIAQHCGLPQYIPAIRQNLNGRSLDELLSAGMLKKGLARAGIRDMHHQQCIVEAAAQLDQRAATADASAAQKSQGGKDKNEPAHAVSVLPTLSDASPRRHSLLRKAEEANRRRALLTAPRLPPVPGARPSARGPVSPRTPRPYDVVPRSASSQTSRSKQSEGPGTRQLQSNAPAAVATTAAARRPSPADRKACVRIVATSKEYEELTGSPYLVRRAGVAEPGGGEGGGGGGGGDGGVGLTPRAPEKPPSSLARPQGAAARRLQNHDPQARHAKGPAQTSSATRQPSRGQGTSDLPQPEDGGNEKLAAGQPQEPQASQTGERSTEISEELNRHEGRGESAPEDVEDEEGDPDKGSAAWHARTMAPALLDRAMSQVLLGMTGGRLSACSSAPTESARSRRSMAMNEAVVSTIQEAEEGHTSAEDAAASPLVEANANEVRQVSQPPALDMDGALAEEEPLSRSPPSKSALADSTPSRRYRHERGAPMMTAASVVHVQVGKLPQGSPRTWSKQQAQHQDQAAIVRIQALERARRARQEAARLKEWRHSQINAATKIQSRRRGIMARRQFQQSLGLGGWRMPSHSSAAGNSNIIPCLESWSASPLDRDPSCPSDIDGLVPMGESHPSDVAITEEADAAGDDEALLNKADTAHQGGEGSPSPTSGKEGRASVSLATILDSRQSPSAARKSVDKAAAGGGGAGGGGGGGGGRMHLPHENLPAADDEEEEEEEE